MRNSGARDLTVCGLFVALIAVGAYIKISIPVEPFPMNFTLQWFFVLMAGLLLGGSRAFICVTVYLVIGLMGLPVFAAGGGFSYLIRPTFGFLLGFDAAAAIVGSLGQLCRKNSFIPLLLCTIPGLIVYYLFGMIYFYVISNYVISMPVGWMIVLVNCCLITVGEDFILCVLAALVCVRLRPVFRNMLGERT